MTAFNYDDIDTYNTRLLLLYVNIVHHNKVALQDMENGVETYIKSLEEFNNHEAVQLSINEGLIPQGFELKKDSGLSIIRQLLKKFADRIAPDVDNMTQLSFLLYTQRYAELEELQKTYESVFKTNETLLT